MKTIQARTLLPLQAGDTIIASCNCTPCNITVTTQQGQLLHSSDSKDTKATGGANDLQLRFTVGAAGNYTTTVSVDASNPYFQDFQSLVTFEKAS